MAFDIEKHEFYDQTINFVDVEEDGDGKKGLIVIGGKTQFIGIARNDAIALAKHFKLKAEEITSEPPYKLGISAATGEYGYHPAGEELTNEQS